MTGFDTNMGLLLKYQQLIKIPKYKDKYKEGMYRKLGRLEKDMDKCKPPTPYFSSKNHKYQQAENDFT